MIELHHFFPDVSSKLRAQDLFQKLIWKKVQQLPVENSHGLRTQGEPLEKRRFFPDDSISRLMSPVIQKHFRQNKVYLYRSARALSPP